jgi:hypothetical protein
LMSVAARPRSQRRDHAPEHRDRHRHAGMEGRMGATADRFEELLEALRAA